MGTQHSQSTTAKGADASVSLMWLGLSASPDPPAFEGGAGVPTLFRLCSRPVRSGASLLFAMDSTAYPLPLSSRALRVTSSSLDPCSRAASASFPGFRPPLKGHELRLYLGF